MTSLSARASRLVALALWAGLAAAHAACPSWPTAERFDYLAGGAEVLDKRTGLTWARCSVGQTWSGMGCTGTVSAFTHEAALALAAVQMGWRLPNRRELASLVDRGCQSLSIDSAAFPSTHFSAYWTSSPFMGDSRYAWHFEFSAGSAHGSYRASSLAVRLVRASK